VRFLTPNSINPTPIIAPNPKEVVARLEKMLAEYNAASHENIIKRIAKLHLTFEHTHPFVDGNKRTAIAVASIFLFRNGYNFKVSNKELERFTLKVAREDIELREIAHWFKRHSINT